MHGPMAFWKQLVVCTALVVGSGALWIERDAVRASLGFASEPAERRGGGAAEGVPVIAVPVRLDSDDLTLEVVGTGRAQRSVSLRPETTGKIVEITLAAGRRFAEGDLLLRLDDRDARLALELAETRLAEAERVRDRYRRLESTGAATAATLDEVSTAAEIARLDLARAREALRDRVLLAPFDGVSGLPEPEVGDWIGPDDEIARFDDRSALLVEFDLPETLLPRVREGLGVMARTPSLPREDFAGTVSAIDSRVNPATRTARVRVAIPNPQDRLRPGASFAVRLELPGGRFPVIPELALQFSRGSTHVWRVTPEGTVERIRVSLVRRRAGEVLVDGPLADGEPVVVEGTQRLAPGKAVRVLDGAAGPST